MTAQKSAKTEGSRASLRRLRLEEAENCRQFLGKGGQLVDGGSLALG